MNDTHQRKLRLGTRTSQLARWQAQFVAQQLQTLGYATDIVCLQTAGDASLRPLTELATVGAFTKALQLALLENRIDLAVHSLKDLPTAENAPAGDAAGLRLAAVLTRHSPHDVLVAHNHLTVDQLPAGARVGTGSPRRRAQLLRLRPDLAVEGLRGNIDSRLRQVAAGRLQAIVLAEAGLQRLGWQPRISQRFSFDEMLPAPGQGALAIEVRAGDDWAGHAARELHHEATFAAVEAERHLLASLRGGCLAPVGAHAQLQGGDLCLTAAVFSPDGRSRLRHCQTDHPTRAAELGRRVASYLLAQGAAQLIAQARPPQT